MEIHRGLALFALVIATAAHRLWRVTAELRSSVASSAHRRSSHWARRGSRASG